MRTMNTMSMLNSKQINLLNGYVQSGKKESFIKDRINWFGVPSQVQSALYAQLLIQNKEVTITDLDHEFSGLQVCTVNNLNELIAAGKSGDWKINVKRAAECGFIRVFSLTDRSLFFVARITGFEPLPNGKYKIQFADAELQRHEFKNIKFKRNVVRYINMPEKISKRKKK